MSKNSRITLHFQILFYLLQSLNMPYQKEKDWYFQKQGKYIF